MDSLFPKLTCHIDLQYILKLKINIIEGVLNYYDKPNKVLVISPLTSIIKEQKDKLDKIGVPAVALSQTCAFLSEEDSDGKFDVRPHLTISFVQ